MSTATELKDLPASARRAISRLEHQVNHLSQQLQTLHHMLEHSGLAHSAALPEATPPTSQTRGRTAGGVAGAQARGEAAKVGWIQAGELVPAKTLADSWGLSPQALGPAAERQEIFAMTHKRMRYYPAEFLALERSVVAHINQTLGELPGMEKLLFWKRPHGALGGLTITQTLLKHNGGGLDKVLSLAQAWTQRNSH
jgi:uncharacterized coiled-coil protein SlyX